MSLPVLGSRSEGSRLSVIRRALRLICAVNASYQGLLLIDVMDALECGRRAAYRWIEACDGDAEVPLEWRKGRLRKAKGSA